MPIIQIAATIPASGIAQFSKFLPARSGGTGNLLASATASPFSDSGTILMQNVTFQDQGTHTMYVGNSSVTNAIGGGIQLTAGGAYTGIMAINYGTYVSDWFVAGTPGDVCVLLGIT